MNKIFAGLIIIAAALPLATPAEAGCVKGAVEGGIIGHVAGGHGTAGAAAGCALSSHSDAKKKQAAQAQPQTQKPN